jgi:hypothetical protein
MFTIPNLGLSLKNGLFISITISFILTLITFLIKKPKEIQTRENALSRSEYFELYLNRLSHWFSNTIIILFPYIFKPSVLLYIIYDVYLLICYYLWYLVIQCPISIHEKRILFKQKDKYTIDISEKIHEVYLVLLMSENLFVNFFIIMYTLNGVLVTFCLAQYYFYSSSSLTI